LAVCTGGVDGFIFSTEKRGVVGNNHPLPVVIRAVMPEGIVVTWTEAYLKDDDFDKKTGSST